MKRAASGARRRCWRYLYQCSGVLQVKKTKPRQLKDQLVLGSSLASNTAKHTWMRPIVLSIHSFEHKHPTLHLVVHLASSKSFRKLSSTIAPTKPREQYLGSFKEPLNKTKICHRSSTGMNQWAWVTWGKINVLQPIGETEVGVVVDLQVDDLL
jgi:hypothetical protein